jgi:aspartyl-tRNA(Asn)/glutamyl-tRNA(Gln) amidotransferase subunit C
LPLSREEIIHVATLCRLGVSEEDIRRFQEQLSNILEQFEVLKEVNTEGVEPASHSVAIHSVMREDEPRPASDKEDVLSNAPRRESDEFRVKAVLEDHGA